jgi:hypothetical protein
MRSGEGFEELGFVSDVCEMELGGLDSVNDKHVSWAKEALRPGSEVTIRVPPAGEFDPPRARMTPDERADNRTQ